MSDPHVHEGEAFNPEVHHEQSDVDVKAILWFTLGLVIFAAVTHVALYFHFELLKRMTSDPEHQPISLVEGREANLPPSPRLQPFPSPDATGRVMSPLETTPPFDMEMMRRREAEELGTYGWLNRANGTVRIPIERAMELQLQRGYPVLETAAPPAEPVALPDRATPATPQGSAPPAPQQTPAQPPMQPPTETQPR